MEFVENLPALIEVNAQSTVSRTVLTSEGVRLVLFSFDKGEELSEHAAAMPVLITVLDGELEVEADGQTVVLRAGGVIALKTRAAHRVLALAPTRMALYMLAPRAT